MKVGLHALGIGAGAQPEVIAATAWSAEEYAALGVPFARRNARDRRIPVILGGGGRGGRARCGRRTACQPG